MRLPRKHIMLGVLISQSILPVAGLLIYYEVVLFTPSTMPLSQTGLLPVIGAAFLLFWISIYRDVRNALQTLKSEHSNDHIHELKRSLHNGRRHVLLLTLIGDVLLRKADAAQHLAAAGELISFGEEDAVIERIDEALKTDPECKPLALNVLRQLEKRLQTAHDSAFSEEAFYAYVHAHLEETGLNRYLTIATRKLNLAIKAVSEFKADLTVVTAKIDELE